MSEELDAEMCALEIRTQLMNISEWRTVPTDVEPHSRDGL